MKWLYRWRRGQDGQGLVEFALILPLLLLLVLGTVDLGMGFKTYIALTNAAREGARYISIHSTDQAGAKARITFEAASVGIYLWTPAIRQGLATDRQFPFRPGRE